MKGLAAGIKYDGVERPVWVRPIDPKEQDPEGETWELLDGQHRLAACRELGLEYIPILVVDLEEMRAGLDATDEDLRRRPLSPARQAAATARRKEIYEALHPETKFGENQHTRPRRSGERKSGAFAPRFTKATAQATGASERSVQRAAERGERIGQEELRAIAGTSLDKGGELDALARMEAHERRLVVDRAASGERVSAAKPPKRNDAEAEYAALMRMWNRAQASVRCVFEPASTAKTTKTWQR